MNFIRRLVVALFFSKPLGRPRLIWDDLDTGSYHYERWPL